MLNMNRAVLIYDGECPLCQGIMRLAKSRARPGELEFLPFQAPQRTVRYPDLSEEACRQAMQLVLPDGRVLAGNEALPETLRRLRGWHWLAPAFNLPGAGLLARHLYRWIARNRYALSHAVTGK